MRLPVVAVARMTLSAARRPALRLMLLGWFAHCLARKASRVAVVVTAFDAGGVRLASLVAVVQLLPAVVTAPFGSVLTARLAPGTALAAGYTAQAVTLALAGAALWAGAPLVVFTALVAAAAGALTLTRPVHQAVLPDVVERPHELAVGNAASAWVDGLASVGGPLLAAAGLASVGGGPVLVALAAGCLAAATAARRVTVHGARRTAARRVHELVTGGLVELVRDRAVGGLSGLLAAQYAVVGLLDVLLVVLAVDLLAGSSADAGALAAALGAGGIVGGVAATALAGRSRLRLALLAAAVVGGVPVALLAFAPSLDAAAVLAAAAGAGKSVLTAAAQTLLQRTVPEDRAAPVMAVQESLIQAGTAAGAAAGPLLVLLVGARGALVATGALLAVCTGALWPVLRRLDRRAVVPGPVFALLRGVEFLSLLSLRTLEQLARTAGRRDVPAGTAVVREGEPGDLFFVIAGGTAAVTASGAPARTLSAGDGFGEIALLKAVPRTATVVASDDLRLVTVDREHFLAAVSGVDAARAAAQRTAEDRLADDDSRRTGPA